MTTGAEVLAGRAQVWAETVADALATPFPYQAQHMSASGADCDVTPWVLHPAFHGSLDWHSSCHMQASAIRLLGLPNGDGGRLLSEDVAQRLIGELDARLTEANADVEAAYLRDHPGFERPYGWGWAAKLAQAAAESSVPEAERWASPARRVANAAADNIIAWLPKLMYPVRNGQHDNTAYGLLLAREGFGALGRDDVVAVIDEHSRRLFVADTDYPSRYEPGGNDFLSPALTEALLMKAVLGDGAFGEWLSAFLPQLGMDGDVLLRVPQVADREDGKLVHLFGLALFRAEALATLAADVDRIDVQHGAARAAAMRDGARAQAVFALEEISHGHFMSTHWLVSFALRAVRAAMRTS